MRSMLTRKPLTFLLVVAKALILTILMRGRRDQAPPTDTAN